MSFFQSCITWVLQHKLLTFLSLTTFIFFICTVSLGAQNSNLKDELDACRRLTTPVSPTSITTTKSTKKGPPTMSTTAEPKTTTSKKPEPDENWRLPKDQYTAEHYDVTLVPNLKDGTFEGIVVIDFTTLDHLTLLKLHTNGLKFTSVLLDNGAFRNIKYHKKYDLASFDIDHELDAGKHKLEIHYTGDMKNRIVGFYRSEYKTKENKPSYIATSKLEPTYARQVFPCFDEPNFKAKYTVHLVKPKSPYIALSNMDQDGDPKPYHETSELVSFKTSVPMSTYLTCFIVGDFKYKAKTVEVKVGDPIALKVYATPEQVEKTTYALEVAESVIKHYVEYFDIEYPLPKLDLIAIPDFVSGAMEHWGLVTFRETALLYDPVKSSTMNKERVATVIAHELAHMWFGNLVTLDWWNDLWLNEGFATYMQFKSIDKINKDWKMAEKFLIDELHPVMEFDATLASHPIVQTVTTPDEITEIFDTISYNKGASVLRMLENAVGADKFKTGITQYLNKYKFKTAVTKNLWDELDSTNPGFKIKEVMDTWTIQMGYPVVNVMLNEKKDGVVLTQKRFLSDQHNVNLSDPSPYSYKWTIPITFVLEKDTKKLNSAWFKKEDDKISLSLGKSEWIKINSEQVGYYRVNYDKDLWKTLTKNIMQLSLADRANLLEDAFSLAKAGQLPYDISLDLSKYLKTENDYVPWAVAASKLKDLKMLLNNFEIYGKLQKYVQDLVDPIYKKLTWNEKKDGETHVSRLLRVKILDLACWFGHKDCLTQASALFTNWINIPVIELVADTKPLFLQYGIINANEDVWNEVFEKYVLEIDAQEKMKLLKSLASSNNPALLHKLIERAKNEDIVRGQDYFTCLQYISSNPIGTAIVWDYVREHWDELVARFTLNDRYLGKLIPAITSTFSTEIKLNEMKEFFKKHPDAGAGAIARKQALETVSINIKWINSYKEQVEKWLNNKL